MSGAEAVIGRLAAARARFDAASDLLLSPSAEAVERCSALFETAAGGMADLAGELAAVRGHAGAIEEAWQARRSFVRASRLLENAARFHRNWEAVRGAMTGGYTRSGEPAPLRHSGRICLEA